MVSQKYRWDFIGLSTDEKPTSETSDKVVNGSTYYCSDTSKLYVYCDGTWYERKPLGGGGGGTSNFDQLTNRPKYNGSEMTSSTDIPEVKTYTAGTGINISNGVISATSTGPNVVQTTGTSTTNVMSQNAVTSMVYGDTTLKQKVRIGTNANTNSGSYQVAIGYYAKATNSNGGVAVGYNSFNQSHYAVALGAYSMPTQKGQMDISTLATTNDFGYNGSQYRLLTGVYDGQSAHDAATYGQVVSYSAINGAGAPTTATEGKYVGQLYYDTTNEAMYFLKTIDTTTTPTTYTWEALGGGGSITPVQTTGTSTTDVMSQNATTSMVFADPSTRRRILIGTNAISGGDYSVVLGQGASSYSGGVRQSHTVAIGGGGGGASGTGATTTSYSTVTIGSTSSTSAPFSVAIGAGSQATAQGQFDIGCTVSSLQGTGYNNSNYRLLTGLYDPQNAHDAATKGYVDPSTDSSAPTTATVGRLGQIQIDTTNNDAYMCVAADDVTPAYTWKKITV